ncbi:MAG: DUF711 family protein [Desulfurococcales archaeon]|nr:DUF711 family protein [Desulfurococcales archaeon]
MVYIIRTITVHASQKTLKDSTRLMDVVDGIAQKTLEAADRVRSQFDLKTGMVRVTLPDLPQDKVLETIKSLDLNDRDPEYLVSIGNIPVYHPFLEDIVLDAVSRGLFLSILNRPPVEESVTRFSKLVHKLSQADLNYPTRVGFNVYGRPVYTPYYPLSSSPGDRDLFSIALTYPNHLRSMLERRNIKEVEKELSAISQRIENVARTVREVTGLEYLGLDLSLSPWMDESVGRLIEAVSGRKIPQAGSAYGVYVLNTLLSNAADKTLSTGFNEVQLPVAEDNILKERAREGLLSASSMARLTGVCLAGLDLVVVPYSIEKVRDVVLEVFSYSLTKNRPLGVRIVPVEEEPGNTVKFEKFGETTVIPF